VALDLLSVNEKGVILTLPETMQRAAAAYGRGAWAEAAQFCRMALDADPHHFDALHLAGVVAGRSGRTQDAADLLQQAVAVNPNDAIAHYHLGIAFGDLQRHGDALKSYDRALALKSDLVRAHNNRGNALDALDRHAEAVESYGTAIRLKPDYAEAFNNRGVALAALRRDTDALADYGRALALKPDYAEALNNRGNALCLLRRHEESLDSYRLALGVKPNYAEALNNYGSALSALGRHAEALESFDRALRTKLDFAEAFNNRGIALFALQRHAEALQSYARALDLKPDYEFLYGRWLHARMKICEWEGFADHLRRLEAKIERRESASQPLPVLAISASARIHRMAAEIWADCKHPEDHSLPELCGRSRRDRMRIGYFSADFREHAVSRLIAGLFECHDRSKFEITGFSLGPDTNDAMRSRLAAGLERLIDVRAQSDRDVAMLARTLEIDIAVDLNGFTQDGRSGIFVQRAAPLQVNFLGYPGTMGARYIDYIVADRTLIPEASQQHYAESIVYLPDSYQPNDAKRRIGHGTISREASGLPHAGFVFCCFNNNYKITPATFASWMRILGRVDGSVLWLLEDNELATANLRKEAASRGIGAERLVFAPLMPMSDHLARHRWADLFLDTLPYNAHTTASDALWAGVPVVTRAGEAFAGRVAASLLKAVGMPELVTATPEAYEELAIDLATHPDKLASIRKVLDAHRDRAPLFDPALFARHLEAAYTMMYERHQAGLAPAHLYVQGSDETASVRT